MDSQLESLSEPLAISQLESLSEPMAQVSWRIC